MPCTLSVPQFERVTPPPKTSSGILRISSFVYAQYNARCYLDHFCLGGKSALWHRPFNWVPTLFFSFSFPFSFSLSLFFPFSLPPSLSFCSFFFCFLPLNPFFFHLAFLVTLGDRFPPILAWRDEAIHDLRGLRITRKGYLLPVAKLTPYSVQIPRPSFPSLLTHGQRYLSQLHSIRSTTVIASRVCYDSLF